MKLHELIDKMTDYAITCPNDVEANIVFNLANKLEYDLNSSINALTAKEIAFINSKFLKQMN
jgi:hypothetical protein